MILLLGSFFVVMGLSQGEVFMTPTFPTCQSTPKCENETFLTSTIEIGFFLTYPEKKILMEFSPKAACTNAVVMFLENMGYHYKEHYNGWPHDFRETYFYHNCSTATPCMLSDPSWKKFKVVRNPFTRAVSSYLHVMRYDTINDLFKGNLTAKDSFRFEDYVFWLSTLDSNTLYEFAFGHFKPQANDYEIAYFQQYRRSLFDVVIPMENADQAVRRLNTLTRESFNLSLPEGEKHVVKKTAGVRDYAGNVPWNELKDRIPSNYGLFYNDDSRKYVESVYKWDFLLYDYSYPWKLRQASPRSSSPFPSIDRLRHFFGI